MGIGNIPQTVWRQTIGKHIRRRREEILSPISVEERCSILSGEKSAALVWTDTSLSGNSEKIGEYALLEAVNNLAAKGAEPVGVSVLASQSPSMEKETLERMIISMEGLCEKVSAQITCVRAEGNPGIDGNMVYVTAAGILREESQPLLSQITPEMEIILCGYAGLEGTLLIESEAKEELKERFIPTFLRRTEELEEQLCMPAVLSGAFRHGAAAMRQIGSGGIFAGLWELTDAAKVGAEIALPQISLRQETVEICEYYRLNPYQMLSAGSVLMVTDHSRELVAYLEQEGVKASKIGVTTANRAKVITNGVNKRYLDRPAPDEWLRWQAERMKKSG